MHPSLPLCFLRHVGKWNCLFGTEEKEEELLAGAKVQWNSGQSGQIGRQIIPVFRSTVLRSNMWNLLPGDVFTLILILTEISF